MDRVVCYIPSYNDSQQAIESLASSPDWDVVISDNFSNSRHAEALTAAAAKAGPRVRVVRQPQPLGRVGNWRACVEHFIGSGATWMKFLSAGDRHRPDSLAIFRRAIERYPEARFIIGQVEHVRPVDPGIWTFAPEDMTVEPHLAMEMAANLGNVFFGLTAPLFHVDTVRDRFTFCEDVLSFCADMIFLMGIARRFPTYYIAEVVAEMVYAHRKTFQAKGKSLEAFLEMGLAQLRAADTFLELSDDRAKRNQFVTAQVQELKRRLEAPAEQLAGTPPPA